MTVDIHMQFVFVGPEGSTDEDFEAFLDAVMEGLDDIGRDDIAMTASLAKRVATLSLFADDGDVVSTDRLLADLRTALHAANCATPGWEDAQVHLEAAGRLSGGELLGA